MVWRSTYCTKHGAVQCDAVRCSAVQCSRVWCSCHKEHPPKVVISINIRSTERQQPHVAATRQRLLGAAVGGVGHHHVLADECTGWVRVVVARPCCQRLVECPGRTGTTPTALAAKPVRSSVRSVRPCDVAGVTHLGRHDTAPSALRAHQHENKVRKWTRVDRKRARARARERERERETHTLTKVHILYPIPKGSPPPIK